MYTMVWSFQMWLLKKNLLDKKFITKQWKRFNQLSLLISAWRGNQQHHSTRHRQPRGIHLGRFLRKLDRVSFRHDRSSYQRLEITWFLIASECIQHTINISLLTAILSSSDKSRTIWTGSSDSWVSGFLAGWVGGFSSQNEEKSRDSQNLEHFQGVLVGVESNFSMVCSFFI